MGSSSSSCDSEIFQNEAGITKTPFHDIPDLKGPLRNGYFVRPSSTLVTPIWYKYDIQKKEWFWTPYYDAKIWMSVRDMKVTLGMWRGQEPAKQNKRIIHALQATVPSQELIDNIKTKYEQPENFELIDDDISLDEGSKLQFFFALKGKHPIMIIYPEGKYPQKADDDVVRVDLIAHKDENVKKMAYNIVRLQERVWDDHEGYEPLKQRYRLICTMDQLIKFCKQYQMKNLYYEKLNCNCRKFMEDLCQFLQVKCDKIGDSEAVWYKVNPTAIMNLNMDKDLFDARLNRLNSNMGNAILFGEN